MPIEKLTPQDGTGVINPITMLEFKPFSPDQRTIFLPKYHLGDILSLDIPTQQTYQAACHELNMGSRFSLEFPSTTATIGSGSRDNMLSGLVKATVITESGNSVPLSQVLEWKGQTGGEGAIRREVYKINAKVPSTGLPLDVNNLLITYLRESFGEQFSGNYSIMSKDIRDPYTFDQRQEMRIEIDQCQQEQGDDVDDVLTFSVEDRQNSPKWLYDIYQKLRVTNYAVKVVQGHHPIMDQYRSRNIMPDLPDLGGANNDFAQFIITTDGAVHTNTHPSELEADIEYYVYLSKTNWTKTPAERYKTINPTTMAEYEQLPPDQKTDFLWGMGSRIRTDNNSLTLSLGDSELCYQIPVVEGEHGFQISPENLAEIQKRLGLKSEGAWTSIASQLYLRTQIMDYSKPIEETVTEKIVKNVDASEIEFTEKLKRGELEKSDFTSYNQQQKQQLSNSLTPAEKWASQLAENQMILTMQEMIDDELSTFLSFPEIKAAWKGNS